ncbi:hypothetical protein CPT03_01155 [Pedobacter ginsengisoli]|uniref:DUF3267 domain-containing protein n=1 Tax=Pedobacter ginsengisoli TaxID=363852 RepID=A0A2D1U0P7_9SPHI|nr:DUF3267 domain-containing protein [Pedobacter ginsengisoli]ATP55170.1 hypothetical protein CPT03_01155 [Pedobacter ginsengisoli]
MEQFNISGYKMEEMTIDAAKAQITSIVYFIPFVILFCPLYYFLWGDGTLDLFKNLFPKEMNGLLTSAIMILVILIGIVLHELIHGITWCLFAKERFKSIKFGVIWKAVTPYCHCKEPLKIKHYILGAIMPAILLGIIPVILALITGNIQLFAFGMFFTMAAGGDFMMINMIRKLDMETLVQDHPSKIGCIVYKTI